MTRIIWSRRELERDGALNEGTLCIRARLVLPHVAAGGLEDRPPGASFERLFHEHYAALRRLLDGRAEPGLALLAVGASGVEASAWFVAKNEAANPLILGRHSHADVFLPEDPRISLRHLAVVLHRRQGGGPVRFRVLDLRTPLAFSDEEGSRLEAIEASGPVLLWCGALAFFLFPTGVGDPSWPARPAAGWSRVPERRYTEKAPALPRQHPVVAVDPGSLLRDDGAATTTLVHTFAGPVFPTLDADEDGPARGELRVASACGRVAVRLGARAAHRGILLGRYDRCDTAGLPVLTDRALSRVHLLVLELDGVLYAIDTASKNGTWCGGERSRVTRLLPGRRLLLADEAAVEWRPFH